MYFSQQDLALEDTETFTMDGLECYTLKSELLDSLLNKEPSQQLIQQLKATGHMPHSAFGQLLLEEQLSSISDMAERLSVFKETSGEDREVNVQIVGADSQQPVQLTGWLTGLSASAMVHYRPSAFKGKDLIKNWIEHLCLSMLENPVNTLMFDLNICRLFPPIDKEQAQHHLAQLIFHYQQGQNQPLPWFPQTAFSWLQAEPDEKPEKAASAAQKAFAGDGFHSVGENSDEYIQRVYPELEPVISDMIALTDEIMAPAFSALQEVQP